jgi:predicted HicB family RNase H-like nuclease
MTPPDTQALTVRLPPDLYDKLRKAAFDQHTSMNALIIAALRHQQDASGHAVT